MRAILLAGLTLTVSLLIAQVAWAEPSTDTVYYLKASIVKVNTVTNKGGQGVGSGVVVAENTVATNCHVLADSNGINVTASGEFYLPIAVQEDWRHDVCILRFQFLPLKPAQLGDSDQLQYEQSVFSIGFPGGPPKPLTTYGQIKALYPMDGSFVIRTSASFIMGASGSPIFDDEGKLLGMNTVKSPGRHAYYYGVPVNWIKQAMKLPERPLIGEPGTPFWDAQEDLRPYFMRVVLPLQNGEWTDLKQIAQAWVQQEPSNLEARYYLALAAERLGETEQARAGYKGILAVNARHTASMGGLGRIANKAGDQAEAARLSLLIQGLDKDSLESLSAP
jgi:serine protease Do